MDAYTFLFIVLIIICVLCFGVSTKSATLNLPQTYVDFQRKYLLVYLLAMGGDWLQGPHVYALYESYNISTYNINVLFVLGFGSSMVFGTFIGACADRFGRKLNCILYGVLYGIACITKHFPNITILMCGRFLAGIATSVLYSAFESWFIYEHNKQGYNSEYLSHTFSIATLGNSLVAIIAGLVAQFFADIFGFVAPFDVSLLVLIVMSIVIFFTWQENYGNYSTSFTDSFFHAWKKIKTDRNVLCLGIIQSLFEGSMYTFVLEWTPALTPTNADRSGQFDSQSVHRGAIPHGIIFASFMVAIMIGSFVFKFLAKCFSIESFMRAVLCVATLSLFVPVVLPNNTALIYCGFIIFEGCVGIFWPSIGTMRGKYVPEETRATVMNVFRVPLNLIVVIILLLDFPLTIIFGCCTLFLAAAVLCQMFLYSLCHVQASASLDTTDCVNVESGST